MWTLIKLVLILFAGGLLTSYLEYQSGYNLYYVIRAKVFRRNRTSAT